MTTPEDDIAQLQRALRELHADASEQACEQASDEAVERQVASISEADSFRALADILHRASYPDMADRLTARAREIET